MNYRMILRTVGFVLSILAALMLLPLIAGVCYGEGVAHFAVSIIITGAIGLTLSRLKPRTQDFYARDGFVTVGLVWISMSLLGALPFVLSGDIPNYLDAVFETVSGFTTTGATILPQVEVLSRGCMFWRMFTQWIGGMGVLVFMMAVMPMCGDHSMHIMRAEFPGPTVGKLVPRARQTALACISNIGPGMGQIGPASCFNIFSAPVKMVLAVIMLLGRLELYPILAFFAPTTWRK